MNVGKPKRNLTRDKIIDSAARLIEAHDAEGLTMRKLAGVLGVEAMSLYNHFKNKNDLLEAVAERLVDQVVLPSPTGDWQVDVRSFATAFRAMAHSSPKVTAMLLSRQLFTTNILRITDQMLRILQQGGLGVRESVMAGRLILTHLAGTLVRELPQGAGFDAETLATRRKHLEASGLPTVAASAEFLAKPTGDDEFQFGLDLIILAFGARGATSGTGTGKGEAK
jgi:Transcriptional regulator